MSDLVDGSTNDHILPNLLWRHKSPESTPMWRFIQTLNVKYELQLKNYNDLYQWSIENISAFWSEIWHELGIKAPKPYSKVGIRLEPFEFAFDLLTWA